MLYPYVLPRCFEMPCFIPLSYPLPYLTATILLTSYMMYIKKKMYCWPGAVHLQRKECLGSSFQLPVLQYRNLIQFQIEIVICCIKHSVCQFVFESQHLMLSLFRLIVWSTHLLHLHCCLFWEVWLNFFYSTFINIKVHLQSPPYYLLLI